MTRITSFNIHGIKKIADQPRLEQFLHGSSAICFQETLDDADDFDISGYAKYAIPSKRINGQLAGGIATFLSHAVFGACTQSRIPSVFDWILPVHITEPNAGDSLLIINIYFPR